MKIDQNSSPVLRLPFQVDVQRLNDLFAGLEIFSKLQDRGTISLVHRAGATDPWTDGLTQQVLSPDQQLYFSENDFNLFNPGLEGSYFEQSHEILRQACSNRLGRVRLFNRFSRTCSSLHQDLDVRLHVALDSNPSSFLVFPQFGIFQIPADGYVYLVDTTRPHFAVNTDGSKNRVHLVCSTYCGFVEERSKEKEIIEAARELFMETSLGKGVIRVCALQDKRESTRGDVYA